MRSVLCVAVIAVLAAVTIPLAAQQAPLSSHPIDPYQLRADALEQELARAKADLLARDISLSNCSATVDSVKLTKRADAMVEDFKRLYGGEWAWRSCQAGESADCNRPVRVDPTSKAPGKEK